MGARVALAGRRADIAGIHPSLRSGRIGPELAAEFSAGSYEAKIAHVRQAAAAAGRNRIEQLIGWREQLGIS